MTSTAPLTIGTDGGTAPTNPGPSGCAWVAEDGRWGADHLGTATNNIAELTAIRNAIEAHPDRPLHILSDSQYAINCVTTWGPNWRRKGVTGKANMALVFSIIDLMEARQGTSPVTLQWVRAHDRSNSTPLNSLADELANAATNPAFGRQAGVIDDVAAASAAAAARQPASKAKPKKPTRTSGLLTMTEIGKLHGLSAVAVGKILTSSGHRIDGVATEQAIAGGWARSRKTREGKEFSVWDAEKVGTLIAQR